jgi:hypothetical protein
VTPVAHSPLSAIAHLGSTSCPNPPRVHFNGVNSKRVYDALSATLTSPRQRKRFDRTVEAGRSVHEYNA